MQSVKIDYSVIVPAFNEAENIGDTIASIHEAMHQSKLHGELIIADNDSTDDTAAIAENLGAIVVHEPVRQIARARNCGARSARGRFLIFIDADTRISPPLFCEALQLLESGKVSCGGARVEFDTQQRLFASILLKLWQTISRAARLAAGCFVFCRAEGFHQVGGFDEKVYASEEIGFSFRMRAWGIPRKMRFTVINKPGIKTSSRKNQNPMQILLTILVFAIFPAAARFRSLCFLWYACRHKS